MSTEAIGSAITKGSLEQIKARERLISQDNKTTEHLLFFNSNGAWARMLSSVNTLTEEQALELLTEKKPIQGVFGDSTLAQNNILTGGVLNLNPQQTIISSFTGGISEQLHSPIQVDKSGYVTPGDIKTNSYHKYQSLGFRPTPGITSVEVTSRGTYGTLREARVEFKVWTLEDLEVMQALYLRPGYSVFLEWGHSLQLDSKDLSIRKEITTYRDFFNDCKEDPMREFEQASQKLAEDSDYNYDSFVGYISNFNWSLNEQGGYDCSVKIVAKGSVLESIRATFSPSLVYPSDQFTKQEGEGKKYENKSIYHKLFKEMEYWKNTTLSNVGSGLLQVFTPGAANTVAGAIRVASNLKAAIFDTFVGDQQKLLSAVEEPQTAEGRINMQNEGFKEKFEKLKNGDSFFFEGKTYTFGPTQTGSSGFAGLAEEPLEYYLNREFKEYGITFTQAIFGLDAIRATSREGNTLLIDTKKVQATNVRNSFKMLDFIQENSRIPEDQLSPEQKEDRERRRELQQQLLDEEKVNKRTANQTDAKQTGYKRSGQLQPIYTKGSFVKNTSQHFKETLNQFAAFRIKNLEEKGTGTFDNDNLNEFWIPLYMFLDIFNNYVATRDNTKQRNRGTNSRGRKLVQFYTGWQDENTNSQLYGKEAKYLTSDYHFSINPMVCVLPKRTRQVVLYNSKGELVEWGKEGRSYPMGVIWNSGFHKQVESAFQRGIMRGEQDDILNILLSVQFLEEEFDKIIQEDEDSDQNESNNMVTILGDILRAMNDSMGGVNDLDIHYDDSDDLYYIVDRKVTPLPRITEDSQPLALSGKKSTMSNVQISSEISNNIGNMVAIAAQGTGGNSRDNIATLLQWNTGLIDRHIRHKSDEECDTEDVKAQADLDDQKLKKWVDEYVEYWEEFNGEFIFDYGNHDKNAVPSLSGYHKVFCQKYVVGKYYKPDTGEILPPPGPIPVELSFSTIGIGGLKIGQAFTIEPGLLPERYSKDFAYIITGLSHNIQEGKWATNIKTQFYSIRPPKNEEVKAFNKKVKTGIVAYTDPNQQGIPGPVELIDGEDPAPIINPNKIGALPPTETPVYKKLRLDLRLDDKQNVLDLVRKGTLVEIGDANTEPRYFAKGLDTAKQLDGKYYLEATAGRQFLLWANEMKQKNIPFLVSSAVRFDPNTEGGPHGYGIAVDFSNLYQRVRKVVNKNGKLEASVSPADNLQARISSPEYKQIAEIGVKYGWYNPWRLSDNLGKQDEIWHFEYWGQA